MTDPAALQDEYTRFIAYCKSTMFDAVSENVPGVELAIVVGMCEDRPTELLSVTNLENYETMLMLVNLVQSYAQHIYGLPTTLFLELHSDSDKPSSAILPLAPEHQPNSSHGTIGSA